MTGKKKDFERDERRQKVAELYLQGISSPSEIGEVLKVSSHTIVKDLKFLRRHIEDRAIKTLEKRKNKSLSRINLVIRKAWEIFDNTKYVKPETKLSAQRVIISALELEAKVDGLISEKLTVGPELASQALMKRLRDIEEKAKAEAEGNGHKEGEVDNALTRSET